MVKVYLHYEGTQGPEHTEAVVVTSGEKVDDVITRFAAIYNKQYEKVHGIGKGKLDPMSLSLRKAEESHPLSFTLSPAEFLEEIEDREDIMVEDLKTPRKVPKEKKIEQLKEKVGASTTTAAF